jgi:hypothetical protein
MYTLAGFDLSTQCSSLLGGKWRRYIPIGNAATEGPMLHFKNIFAEKFGEKIGGFLLKMLLV